ncbi:NAD-binding protein [Rhodothermaceae bacterium RA]|nr:NAD-binding protein [Rhodothermaceae bacterium RA]
MAPLRWGILSTARIGVQKVIPALQKSTLGTVVAIASRDRDRARAVADDLGIPTVHGSYEALLADPSVDAVYNPLPNHLHVPWSIRALEAGKHVLCEKPLALSSAEAQTLVDAADAHPGLKVMEAFMYRFHPQWVQVKAWLDEDRIGPLRAIQAFFSYFNADPNNIRNQPDAGGGALMDIGCYPISLSRWCFGTEPDRVFGTMERDPRFGTDRLTSGLLDFGSGTASFTCSTQLSPFQRVHLLGPEGRITLEIPFNAPPDRACRLWLQQGRHVEEVLTDAVDQYTAQGDAFARAVLDDTPVPTPLHDAVANLRVLERLVRSSERGTWA